MAQSRVEYIKSSRSEDKKKLIVSSQERPFCEIVELLYVDVSDVAEQDLAGRCPKAGEVSAKQLAVQVVAALSVQEPDLDQKRQYQREPQRADV